MPRTLVVGVGNDGCGDDAVGPLTARSLAGAWPDASAAGVDIVPWTGPPLDLLPRLEGVERLVLIDALVSGAAPGTIRRIDGDAQLRSRAATSSHGLGVAEVLELLRALGRAPPRVDVWGIEGAAFVPGGPVSASVRRSAMALARRLRRELSTPTR